MAEPINTSTHYGDYKGRVSIDEAEGGDLLFRLAGKVKVPKGYWPVGFSVSAAKERHVPNQTERGWFLHLTVYVVDASIACGANDLAKYAKEHEHVPVFPFDAEIEPAELLDLFASAVKRVSAVMATRNIDETPMAMLDNK